METRLTPTVFNPANAADLIIDIRAADTNHQSANTINLTGGSGSYVLTSVNNNTDGPNGLPVIGSTVASTLTINGNGNTIKRGGETPFRFFDIAAGSGGSLILKNVELEFGSEAGSGSSAEGGAIFNNGTLSIAGGVQLLNNNAAGSGFSGHGQGNFALGGGIYSNAGGTLKLTGNNVFEFDHAFGGVGSTGHNGGAAAGGAIYANTSSATSLTSTAGTLVEACGAFGGSGGAAAASGAGGAGGAGSGGGLFVNATTSTAKATLTGFTFLNDEAVGGNGAAGGAGRLGGRGGDGGAALGGGVAASASGAAAGGASVADSSFLNVQGCQALGGSGGAGATGTKIGAGGNAGSGGNAFGGGIAATGTALTLTASPSIESNRALGGNGGHGGNATGTFSAGGNGGNGGNSGTASGGGLYAATTSGVRVTLSNALVLGNTAEDAVPGAGGSTPSIHNLQGNAGNYAGGFGGGIYLQERASLTSDTIEHNVADGGFFGLSGTSQAVPAPNGIDDTASAGSGGLGAGGGLYVASPATISNCFINLNLAQGGFGGNPSFFGGSAVHGGNGGDARGAGVDIEGGAVTIANSQVESNTAQGGNGGKSNATSVMIGGSGGNAAGGGIYSGGGVIHLTVDAIQSNNAFAGFSAAGHGPIALSSGGGLYVVSGVSVTLDSFTMANLVNNSDSNIDSNSNFGTGGAV